MFQEINLFLIALSCWQLSQTENTEISGLNSGQDVRQTQLIISALGAKVENDKGTCLVEGGKLKTPNQVLNVGNSGTGIRLLTGLLSGIPLRAVIDGDSSIQSRPMDRVIFPLRKWERI